MKIDESKVYTLHFPFLNGLMMSFSVVADSPADAGHKLQGWFEQAQKELAIMFPRIAPPQEAQALRTNEIQPLNQLQISLVEDLATSIGWVKDNDPIKSFYTLGEFIKERIKLPLTLTNFKDIVKALEAIKSGTPQVIVPDNGKPKPKK